MANEIVKVKNIEKYYGSKGNITKAISNISFDVKKGEFVGIMGPSGSGKTTLLNCISTIDKVSSGNIFIANEDITKFKSKRLSRFRFIIKEKPIPNKIHTTYCGGKYLVVRFYHQFQIYF